jgi:hypothetical protein
MSHHSGILGHLRPTKTHGLHLLPELTPNPKINLTLTLKVTRKNKNKNNTKKKYPVIPPGHPHGIGYSDSLTHH